MTTDRLSEAKAKGPRTLSHLAKTRHAPQQNGQVRWFPVHRNRLLDNYNSLPAKSLGESNLCYAGARLDSSVTKFGGEGFNVITNAAGEIVTGFPSSASVMGSALFVPLP